MSATESLYGMVAEFSRPEALMSAVHRARASGFHRLDAYSPMPIEDLAETLGVEHTRLGAIVFAGGLTGMLGAFALQYWINVIDYPLNIGGKPFFSWPSFIPVTFELTILFAAIAAVIGMLALNGLPRPHHPIFGAQGFERASQDRFFLCIEACDPKFDRESTREFLLSLDPVAVTEVTHD